MAASPREVYYQCPLTGKIMRDPVITADGHTYERTAIEAWLENHNTSPITGLPLKNKKLIPNHAVRDLITVDQDEHNSSSSLQSCATRELFYKCPITNKIMHDPVIAADGCTYERTAIEAWLKNNDTSPLIGLLLNNKDLIPNFALRHLITAYEKQALLEKATMSSVNSATLNSQFHAPTIRLWLPQNHTVPSLSISTNNQTFLNDLAVRSELQATFKTYVETLISKSKIMPVPTIRGDIHFGAEKKTVEIDCAENTDAVNALVANHLASKGIKVTIIPATRFSDGFIAIPQRLEIHSSEKLLISVINTEIQLPAMIETLNRRATAGQCRPPLKMGLNPIC